jgi:hypothetical protein
MVDFVYNYMRNEHTAEHARAIGKVAKMHFGIDDYYIGDN